MLLIDLWDSLSSPDAVGFFVSGFSLGVIAERVTEWLELGLDTFRLSVPTCVSPCLLMKLGGIPSSLRLGGL